MRQQRLRLRSVSREKVSELNSRERRERAQRPWSWERLAFQRAPWDLVKGTGTLTDERVGYKEIWAKS